MKITRILLAIAAMLPAISHGSAGMFDQFVFTSINNGGLIFYDTAAATGNPDFQSAFLGTFYSTESLQVGGQQKSFKDNSTDVTSHSLFWRITEVAGSFTSVAMPFQFNLGPPGDQQWGGDSQGANADPIEISTNVMSGLANGTYTLEVFSQITTNSVNEAPVVFTNNGGSNYKATFIVVPEPSRLMLLGFGLLGLMFRRRR